MVLLEDTRQQPGKHKNIAVYCQQHGIEIIRTKLLAGDYVLCDENGMNGRIICDTKADVKELAMDVFQSHDRFRRQCETAQKCGIQLIILVEEVLPGGRLDQWKSPLGKDGKPKYKFDPSVLRKAMITMQERYGVRFRFCDGRKTGEELIAYLKGEKT